MPFGTSRLVLIAFGCWFTSVVACGSDEPASSTDNDGGPSSSGGGLGTSSGGGGSRLVPVPKDKFLDEMAKATCEGLEACCRNEGYGYEPGACEEALKGSQQVNLDAPDLVYDPLAAAACIEMMRYTNTTCSVASGSVPVVGADELEAYAELRANAERCVRFATGPRQAGEACEYGTCAVPSNAFAVYCAPPVDKKEIKQAQCWQVLEVGEGEPCDPDPVTPIFRTCVLDDGGTPATTEAEALARALVCDETSKRCVRATTLSALPGESCADKRCAWGRCEPGNQTCVVVPLGQACEDSTECDRKAACVGGVCVAKLADGEPCTEDGTPCLGECKSYGRCAPEAKGAATKQRCEGLDQ